MGNDHKKGQGQGRPSDAPRKPQSLDVKFAPDATLDQKRALHAFTAVHSIVSQGKDGAQNYGRQAKKLPSRIMAAGLGQALAFIQSKAKADGSGKAGLDALLGHISDWVAKGRALNGASDNLLDSIVNSDASFLRLATAEVMAYLQWLNRFADAQGITEDEQGQS
jgi:CRISPR-associated protein Cmr5